MNKVEVPKGPPGPNRKQRRQLKSIVQRNEAKNRQTMELKAARSDNGRLQRAIHDALETMGSVDLGGATGDILRKAIEKTSTVNLDGDAGQKNQLDAFDAGFRALCERFEIPGGYVIVFHEDGQLKELIGGMKVAVDYLNAALGVASALNKEMQAAQKKAGGILVPKKPEGILGPDGQPMKP